MIQDLGWFRIQNHNLEFGTQDLEFTTKFPHETKRNKPRGFTASRVVQVLAVGEPGPEWETSPGTPAGQASWHGPGPGGPRIQDSEGFGMFQNGFKS